MKLPLQQSMMVIGREKILSTKVHHTTEREMFSEHIIIIILYYKTISMVS